MSSMDVTRILRQIEEGSASASAELLPLVYAELRKLAASKLALEKPGQTLQPTALVHEAYLRLVDSTQTPKWNSRGHFFAAAASAMRRILIENARRKQVGKRGGGIIRAPHDLDEIQAPAPDEQMIQLHDALTLFAERYPLHAQLVELRYFAGLSGDEAAGLMGASSSTVDRQWTFARAWLRRELADT